MSRLHLLILWVLAITAGIIYFKRKDVPQSIESQTDLETGANLIAGDTLETIQGFEIKEGEETVTVKKVDGQWSVLEKDNFPANLSTVTRVFEALRELKVSQGVAASQEYYDRFELDPTVEDPEDQPTTITLLSEGEENTQLFLGKTRTSTGGGGGTAGRFVRLSNDDSGIYVVSESFAFLNPEPGTWIEKILTPLEEKPIKVTVTAPNDDSFEPWTVSRKTVLDDFMVEDLAEGKETKTNETALLKSAFSRATFIEMVSEEDYESRADKKGLRKVKATDSAGSTYLITITPEKKEEKDEEEEEEDASDSPMPAINYLVTIDLVNGPTEPDPLPEDASVQEKAVYQERLANLTDIATAASQMARNYEGRYFLVNKVAVDAFLKTRSELVKDENKEKKPVSVTTDPIEVPAPGDREAPALPNGESQKGTPPLIARPEDQKGKEKPRMEAVTPPIRIPPVPKKEEPAKPDEATEVPAKPAPAQSDPADPADPEKTEKKAESPQEAPKPEKTEEPEPAKPKESGESEPAKPESPAEKPAEPASAE